MDFFNVYPVHRDFFYYTVTWVENMNNPEPVSMV